MSCCLDCILIDEACLRKTVGNLPVQITWDMLRPSVQAAHDLSFEAMAGSECFAQWCGWYATPPVEGDSDYAEYVLWRDNLLPLLQTWLCWETFAKYIELNPSVQAKPAGLVNVTSQDTTDFSIVENEAYRMYALTATKRATQYQTRVNNFLDSVKPNTSPKQTWRHVFTCFGLADGDCGCNVPRPYVGGIFAPRPAPDPFRDPFNTTNPFIR